MTAVNAIPPSWNAAEQVQKVGILVWDTGTLAWIKQGPISGGGGGGAVTVADGADVAEGTTTDSAWAGGSGTVIALLKAVAQQYTTQLDYDGSGNVIYLGMAVPGTAVGTASWQIRRLDYSGGGNLLDVLYANGSRAFNQTWTGRAGLTYS